MNYSFNNSDRDYRDAVNYNDTAYYNAPMTVTIGEKKFILKTGTQDSLTHKLEGDEFTLVAENSPLSYISLTVINVTTDEVEYCFLSGDDLFNEENLSYDLLRKDTDEQIKIMREYLPY